MTMLQNGAEFRAFHPLRQRAALAGLIFEAKLRLCRDHFVAKFDPNQPRVQAGSPNGGQWTDGGGSDAGAQLAETVVQTISDTVSQLVFDPIDLKLEEGGLHGGHTISSHVDKSDEELKSALYSSRYERWIGNSRYTFQKEAIGSFDSLESANDLINRALEANPDAVEALLKLKPRERALLEHRFGFRTGREVWSETNDSDAEIRWTFAIRLLMERDGISSRGFRIVTAFPVNLRKHRL